MFHGRRSGRTTPREIETKHAGGCPARPLPPSYRRMGVDSLVVLVLYAIGLGGLFAIAT